MGASPRAEEWIVEFTQTFPCYTPAHAQALGFTTLAPVAVKSNLDTLKDVKNPFSAFKPKAKVHLPTFQGKCKVPKGNGATSLDGRSHSRLGGELVQKRG